MSESRGYWATKNENPHMYEKLGVVGYRNRVIFSKLHYLMTRSPRENEKYPQEGTRREKLEQVIEKTKANERAHLIAIPFYIGGGAALDYFRDMTPYASITAAVLNVAVNGYPIMLQRYNRQRAYNTLDRVVAQENTLSPLERTGTEHVILRADNKVSSPALNNPSCNLPHHDGNSSA